MSLSLALSCYICTNLTSHADESLPVVDYSNNQAWFYTNSHPVHERTLPLFRVITSLVRLSQPSHCLQRPQILLLLSPHTSPQFGDFYTEMNPLLLFIWILSLWERQLNLSSSALLSTSSFAFSLSRNSVRLVRVFIESFNNLHGSAAALEYFK